MKIAILTSTFLPTIGGIEIVEHYLALHLSRLGHDVTVYISGSKYKWNNKRRIYEKKRLPLYHNFNNQSFPYKIRHLPIIFYELYKRMPAIGERFCKHILKNEQKKYNYDIWHAQFIYPPGSILNLLEDTPKVVTCQGVDIHKSKELNWGYMLDPKLEKKIIANLRKYDDLIAVTEGIKKEYMKFGCPLDSIHRSSNGVSVPSFRDIKATKEQIREELKLPRNKFIIITIGRNVPVKGYNRIPKIAEELKKLNKRFYWMIIGREVSKLRDGIKSHGLEDLFLLKEQIGLEESNDNYEFPSKELIKHYKASDAYFSSSRMEVFGICNVEAMASGIPAIVSKVSGNRDIIKENHNGILFGLEESDKEIASKIDQLINDKEKQKSMSKNSLREVWIYDWANIAKEHEEIYKKVIRRSKNKRTK